MSGLLALYFTSELIFATCAKTLSDPLGVAPTSIASATCCWAAYLVVTGHWRRLRLDAATALCALGGAAILVSLTLAVSLRATSLLLPLVLMKAGALLLAPLLDGFAARRIPTKSVAVFALVLAAVLAVMWGRSSSPAATAGAAAATVCALVYLAGYAAKLRAISGRRGDWAFFVSATTLTLALSLPASLLLCYLGGARPSAAPLALLCGAASQGCGVFGGLVLLGTGPRDTHTALVPLHRCASLLAGVAATLGLALLREGWGPGGHFWPALAHGLVLSPGEAVGASLTAAALWLKFR